MADRLPTALLAPDELHRGGDGGNRVIPPGGWAGDGARGADGIPQRVYVTGMGVAICGILMFFAALLSASIVRRGLAIDWHPLELPRILWLNTAILLVSSVTLWLARKAQRAGDELGFRHWWTATTVLGVLFLAGQVIAWRQLAAAGIFLATNPTAGFFYVFTGAHALHLAGGIVALLLVQMRPSRWLRTGTVTQVMAMYWHFLAALWLVLLLFFVWEKYS